MTRFLTLTMFIVASAAATLSAGCSGSGAAMSVGKNLMRKGSDLKIWLDGQEAKQNTLKKAAKGYARYEVKEPVSVSPKLKYELENPDKHGFIKHVLLQVHQKFEADFSDIADFIVCSKDMQDHTANLKPDTEYDLANLGPEFKIIDGRTDKDVDKIVFKPGVKYMLSFTVVADKSESTQIFFETK